MFELKQKTAYEMAEGDWSSDVCSADLLGMEANCPEGRWIRQRAMGREAPERREYRRSRRDQERTGGKTSVRVRRDRELEVGDRVRRNPTGVGQSVSEGVVVSPPIGPEHVGRAVGVGVGVGRVVGALISTSAVAPMTSGMANRSAGWRRRTRMSTRGERSRAPSRHGRPDGETSTADSSAAADSASTAADDSSLISETFHACHLHHGTRRRRHGATWLKIPGPNYVSFQRLPR